ncbi:MAG: hypothetical protein WB681_12175 [Candidatus Cybelea sp.]
MSDRSVEHGRKPLAITSHCHVQVGDVFVVIKRDLEYRPRESDFAQPLGNGFDKLLSSFTGLSKDEDTRGPNDILSGQNVNHRAPWYA